MTSHFLPAIKLRPSNEIFTGLCHALAWQEMLHVKGDESDFTEGYFDTKTNTFLRRAEAEIISETEL